MEDNLERENNDIEIEIEKETKPVNKKLTIFNFLLIILIFVVLFTYMIKVDGIDNILKILHTADYKWVLGGVICLIIYWICETLTLHIPLKRLYKDQKITSSLRVSMIGQLFNNITPFASGGQAVQAYVLNKENRRISDSLSVMALKFIITQIALVVSTLFVVVLEYKFFMELMQDYIWVAILGFVINIIAIIVVILAGVKKRAITIITNPIITLLGKIRIIKNPEKIKNKLDASIENFEMQFKVMKSEKKMTLKMFITAVIQSFAYYSITYMVYRAFGNSEIGFLQIIPVQALLLLIMTFIPTPGSGLGAEGGFYLLFNSIFKEGTINISILFWRIYTFYLPIIIGSLFLLPVKKKIKNKK